MIDLQLENVEIRVHETPDGFLVFWGDYIANTWLKSFETLPEVFTWLALVTADAQHENDYTLITRTLEAQDVIERPECERCGCYAPELHQGGSECQACLKIVRGEA